MYERVLEEMAKTCAAIKSSGQLFMYAEDWIYTPAVTKAVEPPPVMAHWAACAACDPL
jgi:hypothetical protein